MPIMVFDGLKLEILPAKDDPDVFGVTAPSYGPAQVLGWVSRNHPNAAGRGGGGWAWFPYNGDARNPRIGPQGEQRWHGLCSDQDNAVNLLAAFWLTNRPPWPDAATPPATAAAGTDAAATPLSARERMLIAYALGRLRKDMTADHRAGDASPWPRPADVDALLQRLEPKEKRR